MMVTKINENIAKQKYKEKTIALINIMNRSTISKVSPKKLDIQKGNDYKQSNCHFGQSESVEK